MVRKIGRKEKMVEGKCRRRKRKRKERKKRGGGGVSAGERGGEGRSRIRKERKNNKVGEEWIPE